MTVDDSLTYHRLQSALPPRELAAAVNATLRLRSVLGELETVGQNTVLVAYGGGKDSSFALAFVRAMQLVHQRLFGSTFRMRVVTNRHAGMPRAVMENIDRVYNALEVHTDPNCELLCVDGNEVSPFHVDLPLPRVVVERNRLDVLMAGQRSGADGRATFCNACNLSMARAFAVAGSYGGGVDVIVTGDSPEEQRLYYAWTARLARRLHVQTPQASQRRFTHVLSMYDGISRAYFADIHGADGFDEALHTVPHGVPDHLSFFSIYDETKYDSGSHWDFLTEYLGFVFDDLAFSFSESDCGNPGLMAHLRGLKCEHLYGRSYGEGIAEYVGFAVNLMRRKDFPEHLIDIMERRYGDLEGIEAMRKTIEEYAWNSFRITPEQLICMAFAPFANAGEGLSEYLRSQQPELVPHMSSIHELLADASTASADSWLAEALERLSGLSVPQLATLYRSSLLKSDPSAKDESVLAAIRAGDPHKEVVRTRQRPDGAEVLELISGR